MKTPQILSTTPRAAAASGRRSAATALPFDACQVGVVLRAVLLVELLAAAAALFWAAGLADWLVRVALLTSGLLPATLAWLLAACAARRALAALPAQVASALAVALGAVCGLGACWLLMLTLQMAAAPWLGSAVAGALVALLLVGLLQLRARGRTPAAVTAQLATLQARIRPHFLFNTLNSAIALVRAEPARAEALLEDLSELFRHALDQHGDTTTLAEEIALAERYLAIEQVRFGERLRVEWALDPAAGAARVPALLLQPLVENAVVHGVEPHPEGGRVRITTEVRGATVLLKIANTLPADAAPPARGGHGMALDNVRARLALLHDVEGDFHAGRHGAGYRVRIRLPLHAGTA